MKKSKILVLVLAIAALFIIANTAVYANENSTEPTLSIKAANLSFEDSVYVLYAISHDGIAAENITMLFWNEPQPSLDSYTIGTESYSKGPTDLSENILDTDCVIFENNELRAKNMSD